MSLREKHVFQFTGKQISDAAHLQAAYHDAKRKFWESEYQKAVTEAKAKGVEIREVPVTGGKRAEMVLDPHLQQRISECMGKIENHQRLRTRYTIEQEAYQSQSDRTYDLDPEDLVYFHLSKHPRGE